MWSLYIVKILWLSLMMYFMAFTSGQRMESNLVQFLKGEVESHFGNR